MDDWAKHKEWARKEERHIRTGMIILYLCMAVQIGLLLFSIAYFVSQRATGGDPRVIHAQPVMAIVGSSWTMADGRNLTGLDFVADGIDSNTKGYDLRGGVWHEGKHICVSVAGEVARQWPDEVCK